MNISEFELIKQIKQNLVTAPVDIVRGIGEDCAVIKKDDKNVFLISTDCLIEKVHFDLKYFSFIELGKKAMAVNLSDIAAMGGKPLYAFVTLGIPEKTTSNQIMDFYTGLQLVSGEFSTAIVGGDTSSSPGPLFVSLTVVGVAKNESYKLRSTAKIGDGIYVSGCLGSSALGLKLLNKKKMQDNIFTRTHKTPRPKILLGQTLAELQPVHAMIDVSDGLLQDLTHILKSSQVAAEIDYDAIPRDEGFNEVCRSLGLDEPEILLAGGEDYQLLFTVDDAHINDVQARLSDKRYKITRIGKVIDKSDIDENAPSHSSHVRIMRRGHLVTLKKMGHDHFATARIYG